MADSLEQLDLVGLLALVKDVNSATTKIFGEGLVDL